MSGTIMGKTSFVSDSGDYLHPPLLVLIVETFETTVKRQKRERSGW